MNENKRIGVLGLGARSTKYYLQEIERLSGAAGVNGVSHPMDFARINAHLPDDFHIL